MGCKDGRVQTVAACRNITPSVGWSACDTDPNALYRWALPEDLEHSRENARLLARFETDEVLFTSSIQLDHLLQTAPELGFGAEVKHSAPSRSRLDRQGSFQDCAAVSGGHCERGRLLHVLSQDGEDGRSRADRDLHEDRNTDHAIVS